MRVGFDPRVNEFLRMVNQLEDAAGVLPRWPKRKIEGRAAGGPESAVLVNVSGLDLAREIHGVLVGWCDQIAEERGVEPPDPWLSSWQQTPAGSWVPLGGNTAEVASWLRRHAAWVIDRPWYVEEMLPELFELRRKVKGMTGTSSPPRSMVDLAIELASSGRSLDEVREVARARRAD